MKLLIKNKSSILFIFSLILIISGLRLNAQETISEEIEPYMEFSYWKNTNNEKILKVRMTYFTEILQKPLEGLTIEFFTSEEEPYSLGKAKTDSKGFANFVIDTSLSLPLNMEGMMYFRADYIGEKSIYPASEEVYAQDVNLEMDLIQHEGTRLVKLKASTTIDNEIVPVSDEDIYIYVPRMFSDLMVGEGYFEADGTTEVEFPNDIPGDSLGVLNVTARFSDHYLYGNVEKREDVPWGVPSYHEGPGDVRALWTQIAPKWMIITLSILLAGVWGHYVYAIVSIIRIGKNGKTENKS